MLRLPNSQGYPLICHGRTPLESKIRPWAKSRRVSDLGATDGRNPGKTARLPQGVKQQQPPDWMKVEPQAAAVGTGSGSGKPRRPLRSGPATRSAKGAPGGLEPSRPSFFDGRSSPRQRGSPSFSWILDAIVNTSFSWIGIPSFSWTGIPSFSWILNTLGCLIVWILTAYVDWL